MFAHIHSATVIVADQDAALDFSTNTLGWEKALDAEYGEGLRFVTVVPPGATTQLALIRQRWFGGEWQTSSHTDISRVTHDIDATYATLKARGVTFKQPVEMMPWGQKAAWFLDLDGNELFLMEEAE
jgi:catechol 2,3-dioxygenase-like lactoylglutathione lyase family enzyme